ncbi:MAG: transcription elongation factor GreA [Helicobacter sp.]|nr:transcription elongation factor GreA [Helicobacter sp.]
MREPISSFGYEKLLAELKHLKDFERPNIVKEIDIARGHGDLKENAEYHAAKEKQLFIEARINDLSKILQNCQIIDPKELSHDKVSFGSSVKIQNLDNDKIFIYCIVGSVESDPNKGYISALSPIAKALMGKKEGDVIDITLPNGENSFEILEIFYKDLDFEN